MAKKYVALRVTCLVVYESSMDDPEDRCHLEESPMLREIDLRPYVNAWEVIGESSNRSLLDGNEATADRKRMNLGTLRQKKQMTKPHDFACMCDGCCQGLNQEYKPWPRST